MMLINFNLEHGIWKGLNNLALYFDLVLFWHSFLSLAAELTLFLYLLIAGYYNNGKKYKMAAVDTAAANYEL
jgi:hypothetical protein